MREVIGADSDRAPLLFLMALLPEARPLIDQFSLLRDPTSQVFPLFRNSDVTLIVSGIGKLRAAVGMTVGIQASSHGTIAFNIGLAGSSAARFELGACVVINRVLDMGTGRAYYPDMVVNHTMPEAPLATFDKPVTRENVLNGYEGLVDMEASGFFEAGSLFFQTHQMNCLKIVSDHLEPRHYGKGEIDGWFDDNMGRIVEYADQACRISASVPSALSESEQEMLRQLGEDLRLTQTQGHQLIHWSKSYKIRTGQALNLNQFAAKPIVSKTKRNELFEQLRVHLMDA